MAAIKRSPPAPRLGNADAFLPAVDGVVAPNRQEHFEDLHVLVVLAEGVDVRVGQPVRFVGTG
jgi:hypothetical protein